MYEAKLAVWGHSNCFSAVLYVLYMCVTAPVLYMYVCQRSVWHAHIHTHMHVPLI